MKTFMFPGQGSQTKGMGGDLFDHFDELTKKADKILGYSIKELCLEDPKNELNKTQFTQPALFVVNALSYLKKIEETEQQPDYVAGHSLGEFNALFAAECFDFEAGLKLVKKRGELMSQASDGGMAAIINASKDQIETILQENGLDNIDLANFNSPSQIVISGLKDEIAKAQEFFKEGRMLYYPLNTSGAFHSRFMQPARKKFEAYLKKFKFSKPQIPVVANVSATLYGDNEVVENLSEQITGSVRWAESVQYLLGLGEMEFEEVGHGDVLTKLVHKIRRETRSEEKAVQADDKQIEKVFKAEPAKVKSDAPTQPPSEPSAESDSVAEKGNGSVSAAQEKVDAWNKNYPVGTKVKSLIMDYDDLETRTEAIVLFGHRAAVYMKEYNGYFDLDEIKPL